MGKTTLEKLLLSYDRVEHADIHSFLNKLPTRQKSKYIRMAIRLLIEKQNTGEVKGASPSPIFLPTAKDNENEVEKENNEYKKVGNDFLNIGK